MHAPLPHHPAPAVPPHVYPTADRNPHRAHITQIANLPIVTGIDNTTLTANADPAQIAAWGQDTLVAFVAGRSTNPVADAREGTELVTNYLNMQPGQICVGAANAANPQLPAPNLFGIDGVPPDLAAPLIRQQVLATTVLTLFVFSMYPPSLVSWA